MATQDLSPARIGLRAYDISIGFRNLDERSAALSEFSNTHRTGMAALLAGAIKGRDVITDARALKQVAAEVLKINPWAFESVVRELAEVELVHNLRQKGGEIISFTESVPLLHDDAHERLGENWVNNQPGEVEGQLLVAVDTLAQGPVLIDELRTELDITGRADQLLRTVGENAELMRHFSLRDGSELVVSPLYAFEQPESLVGLFESHPADQVRESFHRVRQHPGFAVAMNGTDPIIEDMVRLGLVPAPTVMGADNQLRSFVIIPYGLDPTYLTSKKQVLERALALIASVRCGEVSGGITKIRFPDLLLATLMDPDRNYMLKPHSSTARQYAAVIRMGMIETVLQGNLLAARLIPTADNIEAVQLARTLLKRQGEGLPERGNEREAAKLLFTAGDYLAPIETIALTRRNTPQVPQSVIEDLWGRALGWRL